MKYALISILFFLPFLSFADSCKPSVNSCGFYLCKEQEMACGPKGYLLAFGHKFCQEFLSTEQNYSPEAHAWLRRVRVCLMNKLQEITEQDGLTCKDIKRDGFRSHADCYVTTGFCELSPRDQGKIAWAERRSFLHREVIMDAIRVNHLCAVKKAPIPADPSGQQ
jgi:hypothetical protein